MISIDRLIDYAVEPLALFFLVQAFVGCGGPSWTAADTKSATDAVHLAISAEDLCAEGALDAGLCTPALVRAVQRPEICSLSSMLYRHGADVPDAGFACKPK